MAKENGAYTFFISFTSVGALCFLQGSHLSPKRDPCREGTFLAQARAWIASQSASSETLATSSSWTHGPQQQRPIIGFRHG